jgi:outer membrane protein OmpA-like peptidoglycan-associated protein
MSRACLTRVRAAALAGLLAAFLGGCAPETLVVLIEDPDGEVGAATLTVGEDVVALDEAGEAAAVDALFKSASDPFVMPAEEISQEFGDTLAAQPPVPDVFVLPFDSAAAALSAEGAAIMHAILASIDERATADISVVGHTDRMAPESFNEALARARAATVRDALVAGGVDPAIIEVTSHGEANPVVATADEVAEPRNRRVEVTVR